MLISWKLSWEIDPFYPITSPTPQSSSLCSLSHVGLTRWSHDFPRRPGGQCLRRTSKTGGHCWRGGGHCWRGGGSLLEGGGRLGGQGDPHNHIKCPVSRKAPSFGE